VTLPEVDPIRLTKEAKGDQEVLTSLATSGDQPEISRLVDVSFRGSVDALDSLAEEAPSFGFHVLEREQTEEGDPWLFLAREQKADTASIKALTLLCLQIEVMFDVEYDGWGCMAQTGLTH
jgi:regulator of RNase E activity RraB